ncbi:MAG: DUF885 domain-containing protein, partial [Gammaproteobacteria bacterium]
MPKPRHPSPPALILAAALTLVSATTSPTGVARAAEAAPARSAAAQRLYALFDSAWQQGLALNPMMATYVGDARYNDRWT